MRIKEIGGVKRYLFLIVNYRDTPIRLFGMHGKVSNTKPLRIQNILMIKISFLLFSSLSQVLINNNLGL